MVSNFNQYTSQYIPFCPRIDFPPLYTPENLLAGERPNPNLAFGIRTGYFEETVRMEDEEPITPKARQIKHVKISRENQTERMNDDTSTLGKRNTDKREITKEEVSSKARRTENGWKNVTADDLATLEKVSEAASLPLGLEEPQLLRTESRSSSNLGLVLMDLSEDAPQQVVCYRNVEEFFKTISAKVSDKPTFQEVLGALKSVAVKNKGEQVLWINWSQDTTKTKLIIKQDTIELYEELDGDLNEDALLKIDISTGKLLSSMPGKRVNPENALKIYEFITSYKPLGMKVLNREEMIKHVSSVSGSISTAFGMSALKDLGQPYIMNYKMTNIDRTSLGHCFWVNWASGTTSTKPSYLKVVVSEAPYFSEIINESSFAKKMPHNYYIDIFEHSSLDSNEEPHQPILSVRIPDEGLGELMWFRRSFRDGSPIIGKETANIYDKLIKPFVKVPKLVYDDPWQMNEKGKKEYPTVFWILAADDKAGDKDGSYYSTTLDAQIADGDFAIQPESLNKVTKKPQNRQDFLKAVRELKRFKMKRFCSFFKNWRSEYQKFSEIARRLLGDDFATNEKYTIHSLLKALKAHGTREDKSWIFNKAIAHYCDKNTKNADFAEFSRLAGIVEGHRIRIIT